MDRIYIGTTSGHGGADTSEDEEESEDHLGEDCADAFGLGGLSLMSES